jgi:DNA invertase Pin-like site-specific DNA recombinase
MTKVDQRCAVYLRVSTDEQTTANQVPELERMISARGFRIVATYTETVSGAAPRRPELQRLLRDASSNYFDTVLVWALDRLGRRMGETAALVLELERLGISVLSACEPWLDTAGPVRHLLVSVFEWVAVQERTRLVERTKAGLARARAQGKRLGRPSISLNPHALKLELAKGGSPAHVARRLGVSRSTFYRELARLRVVGGEAFAGPFVRAVLSKPSQKG